MKLRNEKSIAIIYDAVSISKGLDVVTGSLKQNYYAESATYVPDRFVFPLVLRPRIEIADPNKSIPDGDKVNELARLEWFLDGTKINSNDEFKIEGVTLKVFKNSEEPFVISYRAEWLDPRKKQIIVIEDSLVVSCISLAQNDADATMSLSKPQNWVHNPLKGERVYTINAYVSKGKVYESAVEWYYVNKEGKDVLIDDTCDFYVDGQFTNALNVDSSYMENVVIKAKNISNDKLKEIYWFFDKHGNPLTYAMPEKTIIEGKDVFNLPESPITSKLDYRINGLTNEELKSVQTPIRIKSVGENLFDPNINIINRNVYSEEIFDGKRCISYLAASSVSGLPFCKLNLPAREYNIQVRWHQSIMTGSTLLIYYKDGTKSNVARWSGEKEGWVVSKGKTENKEIIGIGGSHNSSQIVYIDLESMYIGVSEENTPYVESNSFINNQLELKSIGAVSDYIENGKLYKNISDEGEILEETKIINLSTQGNLTAYPNGTIFIDNAIQLEEQYQDGITIKEGYPIQVLESIKVGKEYLDASKAVVQDNLITHPELENGDFVTIEYIYDDNPIYGTNSIGYLSLEEILDDLWLDNVYTYKVTNGEWELVKVTDIEDYEEWLKTEKTSPYTLAPDGVVFGKYQAETKFIRQYPSSLYVDFIAPTRLKEGVSQIKARALVGTRDGVLENPSKYFTIKWYKRSTGAGQVDLPIGEGNEIIIDVADKDMIGIEIESIKTK